MDGDIAIRKSEILQAVANMEFYPVPIEKSGEMATYTRIPLSEISSLGVAFEPLASAVQHVFPGDGSASILCKVTLPKGTHLAEFKNGIGNLGTALDANNQIAGQAVLNPLVCNPTMIFMAAALSGINKKLDRIQETQQEILDFLVQKEKSELKGDLKFLGQILNDYKHNWNNDRYKTANHIKVLDIRQEAERKIDFYHEQIAAQLKKKSWIHGDRSVQRQLDRIVDGFGDYQMALYAHAFSSFLEVMLQENFDSAYLDSISQKIEDYSFQYRELYSKCYEGIEQYSKTSLQAHALRGIATINRTAGEAIAKLPGISKSPVDEALIGAGERLEKMDEKRRTKTMQVLIDKQSGVVRPFIDSINTVNRLYNQPLSMLFDGDTLYLKTGE